MAHVVVVLSDRGGAKGIGFYDVGAGGQILLVYFLNDVRLG